MTLQEAAQKALEAWDRSRQWPFPTRPDREFDALRAALAQPEPIPGATPMSEYAAKSAAVPGRAEALKQAGYTRRPRQLPEEDEQEPVAWQERQEIQQGKFGEWYLIKTKPPASSMPCGITYEWRPLYTHPPHRKPLTDQELKVMWDIIFEFARAIERAHGIENV